jgi:carboxypeptidase PM20D1
MGIGLVALALGLATVLLVRTATLPSLQLEADPAPVVDLEGPAIAEHLAGAIRIRTISPQRTEQRDAASFRALRHYLAQTYPRVHVSLERELVGEHTLLFTWTGSDPLLDPLALLAHQDVVPVEPGTESAWEQPPFSGAIADGYVWGRGALDNKVNMIALLEAAEHLLAEGFRPRRTVLFAFGHDEELGGPEGAAAVAALFQERGIRPALVLDEGGSVVEPLVPGVAEPLALVGIAEKGYVSAELTALVAGGHSSAPPRETSIGVLADAIDRLEGKPLPSRLTPPARALFDAVAPEASFGPRLLLGNLWLFEPLLVRLLERTPQLAALVRTTTAPTIFEAGIKDNVIPGRARAVVNFRILPGDSIESVLAYVRRTVADDRVRVSALRKRREPSSTSRIGSPHYALLSRTIREVFPGAIVAPYLILGGTDSRHFHSTSEQVYRFMPFLLSERDLAGIHGTDERVSTDALSKAVRFYLQLLANADGLPAAAEATPETPTAAGD